MDNHYQEEKNTLLLIDTSALIHRAYHAYPSTLTTKEGIHTNAVFGFASLLLDTLSKFHPEYIVCCLDSAAPTERKLAYDQYKAHRKPMDPELKEQLPLVREVISAFNIPMLELPGQEADDLIGTVANFASVKDLQKILVTGDQDLMQLVDDNKQIAVYLAGTSYSAGQLFWEKDVQAKYGFAPPRMIDYKALVGDSSDNIPGVAGIGKQGGTTLIQQFGGIAEIFENLGNSTVDSDSIWTKSPWKRYATKLTEGKDSALLSKDLATINTKAEIKFDINEAKTKEFSARTVIDLFKEFEFRSLVGRLAKLGLGDHAQIQPNQASEGPTSVNAKPILDQKISESYHLVETSSEAVKLLDRLAKSDIISFDTETDSLEQTKAKIIGLGLTDRAGEGWFLTAAVLAQPKVLARLKAIMTAPVGERPLLLAHNLKYDLHALANFGLEVTNTTGYFDTLIALYLLSGGERTESLGLKDLARKYLGMEMETLTEIIAEENSKTAADAQKEQQAQQGSLFEMVDNGAAPAKSAGKNKPLTMEVIPLQRLSDYCCRDVDSTIRLYQYFLPKIKAEPTLWKLLTEIEMPLVAVLMRMERAGIVLKKSVLDDLGKEARKQLLEIEEKIIAEVGHQFNIASPRQVGEVLFTELKLQEGSGIIVSKTKSGGYSTDERTLLNFSRVSPLVENIMKHRELSKLISTYIVGFTDLLNGQKEAVIHTNFRQTVASTGRLASSEPNLQNIPVSSEFGRKIRKGFSAGEGRMLLAFDYAQQELRLLAHLSGEDKLKEAFASGQDIHSLTASEILGVPLAEVMSDQRRIGKTVNFGVVYGISAFGLADRLKIEQKEAQLFINSFFAKYPKVKQYFNSIKEQALSEGRVTTLMGRIRDTRALANSNARVRGALEREIINFPLQGGAADIMKLAMIKVFEAMQSGKLEGVEELQLHLQIHDELIFSYPEKMPKEKLLKLARQIEKIMAHTVNLSVPMLVDAEIGDNWYDLEKLKL